ncbi:MAG: hypothetical protein HKN39_06470 [Flavobacteriales bacterium]|nr:hypothetical protein [Flavobacteriales bacterium]
MKGSCQLTLTTYTFYKKRSVILFFHDPIYLLWLSVLRLWDQLAHKKENVGLLTGYAQ